MNIQNPIFQITTLEDKEVPELKNKLKKINEDITKLREDIQTVSQSTSAPKNNVLVLGQEIIIVKLKKKSKLFGIKSFKVTTPSLQLHCFSTGFVCQSG